MILYQPSPQQDALLAKWWDEMYSSDDLAKCIAPQSRALSAFLKLFQPPNALLYHLHSNEERICAAHWFEPAFGIACLGCWVAPEYRGQAHEFHIEALEPAYEQWPLLTSLTWQPLVARYLTKLGFHTVGSIPTNPPLIIQWAGRDDFAAYKERYGSPRFRR